MAQQIGDSTAEVGIRTIGTKIDRYLIILERIVVIPQPGTCNGPILVSIRKDRIGFDRHGEILLGSQKIIQIIFGNAPQEIAFIRLVVHLEQDIQRLDCITKFIVDDVASAHPEKVVFVQLG